MSTAAEKVLAAFESLPEVEREAVLAELLLRHPVGAGDLPDAALVELAEERFLAYDAEEGTDFEHPR